MLRRCFASPVKATSQSATTQTSVWLTSPRKTSLGPSRSTTDINKVHMSAARSGIACDEHFCADKSFSTMIASPSARAESWSDPADPHATTHPMFKARTSLQPAEVEEISAALKQANQ